MANVSSATGISSTLGSYSGITSKEIDQMIEASSLPLLKLNNQKSKINEQQNAWKDVKLRLNTFLSKIEALQKNDTFNSKKITSSDDKKVSVTATDKAANDNYRVTVQELATASKLTSGKIPALENKTIYDALNVSGDLVIKGKDGKETAISLETTDGLKELTIKINNQSKETGVKATIVDSRLVLSNVETGKADFSVADNDLAKTLNLSGTESHFELGKNAEFTIDGMKVERSSNKISDVVEHVTFELKAKTSDEVSLGLVQDHDKSVSAAKDLVEQYNNVMTFIDEKLSVGDPSKKGNKTGALSGDSSLIRLQSALRTMMTAAVPNSGNTTINKPKDIGISSVDRTSTLKFDEEAFRKALEKDPQAVQNFFSTTITSKDPVDGTTITTESGYMKGLKELTNSFITDDKDKKSVYTTKTSTFDLTLKDIDSRIDKFTEQIDKKRDYYVRTFTRLDQIMMQAEEQMSYLQSQLQSFMPQ